ncbi:MAG TPA: sulfotransferase [Solirubrobacterales bacterium]|nr:sulfotransferase [Solirubrobacterales bacterium]
MALWEVVDLIEPQESEEHLRTWFIEVPRRSPEDVLARGDRFTIDIKGWVVGRHARATAVELVYHGQLVHTTPVRGERPDLTPAFPDLDPHLDMHFHAMLGIVGLRPEFEVQIRAVLENGMRVPMGDMRVRHQPLRTGYDPVLRPIAVTCLGRSGTTWLMRMLRHHPEIVVYDRHPYEQGFAKYWMHMLRVLSQPADHINSYQEESFYNEIFQLGYNPFYDVVVSQQQEARQWLGREYVERLGRFCQSSIDDLYSTIAAAQGQAPPIYFAEKHQWPNYVPVLMWEIYPKAKEIFMVRDFRDMVFSILAFDRKRGYPGFGRPDGVTDEEYVRGELLKMAVNLRNSWFTRKDRAHLVRYEDLICKPAETAHGILSYLELDASEEHVTRLLAAGAADSPEVREHRTLERAEESIGRWRREGDERFREFCNEVFEEVLGDFGYSDVEYVGQ